MNQYEAQVLGVAIVCATLCVRWVLQFLAATEPTPREPLTRPDVWQWRGPVDS